jgi:hypothetical protein
MLHQAISKTIELLVYLRKETMLNNNDEIFWSIDVCEKNHSARLQLCGIEMRTTQATDLVSPVGKDKPADPNICNFIHHGIIITTPMTLCFLRW